MATPPGSSPRATSSATSWRSSADHRPAPADRTIGLVLVIVSACAFGSGALFAKPVYAAGLDWKALLYWRFLIAALVSWAWLLARAPNRRALRRLSRRRWVILGALGVMYVGNTGTYFAALETVSASLAALLVYIYPVLVAVMALRVGRPLEGRRPWIALGLAVAGIVLAVGGIDPSHAPPATGIALALSGGVIYAVWVALATHLGGERRTPRDPAPPEAMEGVEETDPAPAAALMMTSALAVYAVLAVVSGEPVTPDRVPSRRLVRPGGPGRRLDGPVDAVVLCGRPPHRRRAGVAREHDRAGLHDRAGDPPLRRGADARPARWAARWSSGRSCWRRPAAVGDGGRMGAFAGSSREVPP